MDGLEKLTSEDRFELLSAYVDNELSVSERKQVEAWLESDADMKRQYRAMSALSRSFQSMPAPQHSNTADDLLEAVFTQVDRKPRLWKMAGITASVVAGVGALGALLAGPMLSPQVADTRRTSPDAPPSINTLLSTETQGGQGDLESLDTDSLMLVLEAPPVDIPIVAENTSFPKSSQGSK